jgi:hypothetical protein
MMTSLPSPVAFDSLRHHNFRILVVIYHKPVSKFGCFCTVSPQLWSVSPQGFCKGGVTLHAMHAVPSSAVFARFLQGFCLFLLARTQFDLYREFLATTTLTNLVFVVAKLQFSFDCYATAYAHCNRYSRPNQRTKGV